MKELNKIFYKNYIIHCITTHYYNIYDCSDSNSLVITENLLEAFKLIDYFAEASFIELREIEDEDF